MIICMEIMIICMEIMIICMETTAYVRVPRLSLSGAVHDSLCVSRAYSGYIEYVGANDNTRWPGPGRPAARATSPHLLPLAAQIC
jgi:hypothetical protein